MSTLLIPGSSNSMNVRVRGSHGPVTVSIPRESPTAGHIDKKQYGTHYYRLLLRTIMNHQRMTMIIVIKLLIMTTMLTLSSRFSSSSSSSPPRALRSMQSATSPGGSSSPSSVRGLVATEFHHDNKQQQDEQNINSRGDDDSLECRYDGDCPVGKTCAAIVAVSTPPTSEIYPKERLPGTCLEIPIEKEKHNQEQETKADNYQSCLLACQHELEMDEPFLHEKWPEIIGHDATVSTSGRPAGCVLYYKRTTTSPNGSMTLSEPTTTSIQAWEELRYRHMVRVDPVMHQDNADDDTTWMAYCTVPCLTDVDCQPTTASTSTTMTTSSTTVENPFACQQGACQRNSAFWEAATVMTTTTILQKQQEPQN